nr:MAG: major capsid protein [Microvirus sp.]
MAKIFQTIPINRPKSNVFDLSHERKMSMNMGDLVPCLVQEVIPGDKFRVTMEHLIRFQPLLAPMMHRVNVYTHFFFVPHRIVWNEFEKFITGGEDGKQAPTFPKLYISSNNNYANLKPGTLADYMGVPVSNIAPGSIKLEVSSIPFRAYQLIYNEFYRDQNLTAPIEFSKSSGVVIGADVDKLLTIRKRAWEKDYFTSALPWAQRGEQLIIPLSANASVLSDGTPPLLVNKISGSPSLTGIYTNSTGHLVDDSNHDLKFGTSTGLETDLSNVSSSTINELRQAFQIQKWLERSARSGSRYIEQILAHFGVQSSDARLQRPEYLGGGKTPVVISEVLQTSATEQDSPQGTMVGHGISVGNSNTFKKSFEEHGYVIGIMSVIPRTSYQNGLPRHLQKFDKFDYYWPEFAHIGEQEVYKNEIFHDFTTNPSDVGSTNHETFGYQARYSEYRYAPDSVHGDFSTNLDFWHMGRKFTSVPPLNTSFVTSDPTHRVFAVTDPKEHKLLVQTYVNFQAIRPIAKYGEPAGI